MKYYSEKLKKIFDTEEELKKAEEAVADESKIKEEKLKLLTEIKEKSNELLTLWNKLEELNKIRDYGEQFWQGTKDKMEEGVGIITKGSQTLNSQLTSLDRQFYGRLSATLAELDNCITKMVEQIGKRR